VNLLATVAFPHKPLLLSKLPLQAVLTQVWQVSVVAIGGMMALLLLTARVKAKEDVISKAV
jgi:hypothetical protein